MPRSSLLPALLALALAGCREPAPIAEPAAPVAVAPAETRLPQLAPPPLDAERPVGYAGLHNVVTYAPALYSGSAPDEGEGFDSLRALGVKTIVSVDGAVPNVEAARARGLRYVHLPIGYDGMGAERTLELARAVELARRDGPVYVHCHHGKHRSAGALGAIVVTLGLLDPAAARHKLEVSGTSPSYKGLYRCVEVATCASEATLDALPTDFPERSEPIGITRCMVEVDEVFDHLQAIADAGWTPPADHPDLVPVAEAGRLADLFRLSQADPRLSCEPEGLQAGLQRADALATDLEDALAGVGRGQALDRAAQDGRFAELQVSCADCHAAFRD